MTWTRLWLLLLSIGVLGLLLGGGLLVQDLERDESKGRAAQLALQKQAAELWLRIEASQLIEQATAIGRDRILLSSLEAHERGLAEPALLRQSIQKRLRRLTDGQGLGLLLVTSREGTVLARVGLDEDRHGDSLAGWPLLQHGLRGYRLDDLYEQGGQLFEVVAVPLPTLQPERYAGALVLGRLLDERLGVRLGLPVEWRRDGQPVPAAGTGRTTPRGEAVRLVQRPGSVPGVALWGWPPEGPVPLRVRLARGVAAGLPAPWLLRGALVSGLLLVMGLLLAGVDRARLSRASAPMTPSPVVSTLPVASAAEPSPPWTSEELPKLYADFVVTRVRCGESLGGLSFETFCDEVLGSQARIRSEHLCREVQFRVVVKAGRATVRATPVW